VSNNYQDVRDFHFKFGLPLRILPAPLDTQMLQDRILCLQEELGELTVAATQGDFPGQADALVDLVYFALGTAAMMGLPWETLWDDVHRANLAKERGPTHRNMEHDVRKPPGWVGPQTAVILRHFGWEPDRDVA
jgi:predicted HAD superfamily Cof-like phosphohydrolase